MGGCTVTGPAGATSAPWFSGCPIASFFGSGSRCVSLARTAPPSRPNGSSRAGAVHRARCASARGSRSRSGVGATTVSNSGRWAPASAVFLATPSVISGGVARCRSERRVRLGTKHDEPRGGHGGGPAATTIKRESTVGSDEGPIVGVLRRRRRGRPNGYGPSGFGWG